MNENHQIEEDSEDEVKKVNIDLDRVNKLSSQSKIASISSIIEKLGLATIKLYSKKYNQVKIMEKIWSITRTRPINYDQVDKELKAIMNLLCSLLEQQNLPKSYISHLLPSPRPSEIRKGMKKNNMKMKGEKMKEMYAKRKTIKV